MKNEAANVAISNPGVNSRLTRLPKKWIFVVSDYQGTLDLPPALFNNLIRLWLV
jgi:hypothetical protein